MTDDFNAWIIPDMDFPTYLADPTPEPSLTSSTVRGLLDLSLIHI